MSIRLVIRLISAYIGWTLSIFVLAETGTGSVGSTEQKLADSLEDIRIKNNIPAMAIGIVLNGQIFYHKGFGLTAADKPVSSDTRFRVASLTKLFTAQAIMQLVEKGALGLNDKTGNFLPSFKDTDISIAELLTHHSGLKDKINPQHPSDKTYFQRSLARQHKSKKAFEYADLNFNTLGVIINDISEQDYDEYITNHIINPLGLRNTGFSSQGLKPEVNPYVNGWILRKARPRPFDTAFYPSEGLITSALDLSIWLKATLIFDEKLLTTNTYKEMQIPRAATSWGNIKMGWGWQLHTNKYGQVMQHAGSFKGVKVLLIAYPNIQRGIVILTNADKVPRWEIAREINNTLDSLKKSSATKP